MTKRIRKKKQRKQIIRAVEKAHSAVCFVTLCDRLVAFPCCGGSGYIDLVPSNEVAAEITMHGYTKEMVVIK